MDSHVADGAPRRAWTWKWVFTSLASVAFVAAVLIAVRQAVVLPSARAQAPAGQQFRPAAPANPAPYNQGQRPAPAGQPAPVTSPAQARAPGAGAATASTRAPILDERQHNTAAVVNGEPITRDQLAAEALRRFGGEVLEGLVNRQLIFDACKQNNIEITTKEIDEEIDRIAEKFKLPRDRWLALLREERGYSDEQYKRDVIWPMLALRRLAAGQAEVSPEELKKAFESEFGPKVRARLISHTKRETAEQIRALAASNPAQFGELAKKHCDDPAVASAYGVIPPIRRHLGDANLENIAFSLKPGQISPVIHVADRYYILYCEEQIDARLMSSKDIPVAEERLRERIREGKLRNSAAQFFEQTAKTAKITNVYTDPKLRAQYPHLAAVVNNQQISVQQLAEECVVRHGRDVLEGEINRKLLTQALAKKQLQVTQQDIDAEIARAAASFGYFVANKPDQPDVQRWLKHVQEEEGADLDLYVADAVWPSAALKKLVGGAVQITQEDLQKAYESNFGEMVEVLAIVFGDQRQAQKVWEMARSNPTDAFFGELAEQYSVDPTSRANRGKVPPIRKHSGAPALEAEAFKLKPGELSGLVAMGDQYIIVRCLGRTKPIAAEFNSVRPQLYADIEEKKYRQEMNRQFDYLREYSQIDNFIAMTSHRPKPQGAPAAKGGVAPVSGYAPVGPAQGAVAPAGAAVRPGTAPGPVRR